MGAGEAGGCDLESILSQPQENKQDLNRGSLPTNLCHRDTIRAFQLPPHRSPTAPIEGGLVRSWLQSWDPLL